MALTGPDGETISHLSPADQMNGHEPGMPDRGHWVGPRAGDPPVSPVRTTLPLGHWLEPRGVPLDGPHGLPLDKPQSTLPARKLHVVPIEQENADARRIAHKHIEHLLKNQPMIEEQRRILIQALGVLDSFA